MPSTSPPSINSCFPPRQGSLSLIVNQTNSRSRPTVVHAGTCPSLNRYNSSNTWLDRRSIRSNRYGGIVSIDRRVHRRQRETSRRTPSAFRGACIPSLHPESASRAINSAIAFFAIIYAHGGDIRPARKRRERTTMGARCIRRSLKIAERNRTSSVKSWDKYLGDSDN